MAAILIPSRRTRQPSGLFELDSSWVGRGLLLAYEAGNAATLSGPARGSLESNATFGSSFGEMGHSNSASTSGGVTIPHPVGASGAAFTVMVWASVSSMATNGTLFSIPHSTSWSDPYAAILFRGGSGADKLALFVGGGGGYTTFSNTGSFSIGTALTQYAVTANGAIATFYQNGVEISTDNVLTRAPDYSNRRPVTIFGAPPLSSSEGVTGFSPAAMFFGKALSKQEIQELYRNRFQAYRAVPRRIYFVYFGAGAGGGTTTTIAPTQGALSIVGYLPDVARTANQIIAPSKGALSAVGYLPVVQRTANQIVAPSKGAATVTGKQPGVQRTANQTVAPTKGAATMTGYAPAVQQTASGTIAPSKGALTVTGYAPGIEQDINVAPSKGAIVVTGKQPGVAQNVTTFIAPSKGALTVTGKQPGVGATANQVIAPSAGAVTLAGYAPVLEQTGNQIIGPIKGALTVTGKTPAVQVIGTGITLVEPAAGALTLTGYAPLVRLAVSPSTGGYRYRSRAGAETRPQQENARRPRQG